MPFTFSHPAAIIPLKKVFKDKLSLASLVIGSIVPDFEYFIRLRLYSEHSHTLEGLFYFDLPLGIVIVLLFYGIIKEPLVNNLPYFL
ncbi:MAG: hypothetical protein Kapaf2KO_18540 [Candidatus Kapaibacteriales bacterium]